MVDLCGLMQSRVQVQLRLELLVTAVLLSFLFASGSLGKRRSMLPTLCDERGEQCSRNSNESYKERC